MPQDRKQLEEEYRSRLYVEWSIPKDTVPILPGIVSRMILQPKLDSLLDSAPAFLKDERVAAQYCVLCASFLTQYLSVADRFSPEDLKWLENQVLYLTLSGASELYNLSNDEMVCAFANVARFRRDIVSVDREELFLDACALMRFSLEKHDFATKQPEAFFRQARNTAELDGLNAMRDALMAYTLPVLRRCMADIDAVIDRL